MDLIQYIKSSHGTIPLAAAFRPPFRNFFKFDSLNVVIGANGSGKTTFLMNLAECLHERDESQVTGIEYSTDEKASLDNIRWRTGPLRQLGLIFYTPLPYRRELVQSPNLIDASPKYSNQAAKPRIGIFREVAKSLAIDTELRGTISFSPAVITRILFPVLASDDCEPRDARWKQAALDMNRARQTMQKVELNEYSDGDVERVLDEAKKSYNSADQALTEMLLEYFRANCPDDLYHPLIALASFQKLAQTAKDRPQLARSFLEMMNAATIVSPLPINYTRRFVRQIFLSAQAAAECVAGQKISLGAEIYNFPINEKLEQFVTNRATVVSLSWKDLPSGLLALVDQFSRLRVAITQQLKRGCTHLLILIDEGDAYLHLDWQRRYINLLNNFLGEIKQENSKKNKQIGLQVVLASHSLLLAGDVTTSMITNLKGGLPADTRTFAAPLDQLAFRSFNSYSVGEFATNKINDLHKDIVQNNLSKDDRQLIDQIGDVGVRNALIRSIAGDRA